MGLPVPGEFYERAPEVVAPELLGKVLVSRVGRAEMAGRIVEVEAYLGPHNNPADPAAHSYRGPTPRNRVLFGPAGHAYVYAIYGRYFCFNVSCEREGLAGCLLVRALEPLAGLEAMARNRGVSLDTSAKSLRMLTSGPGRLCQALGLTRAAHDGLDLTDASSRLAIVDDGFRVAETRVTVRIGINVAVDWPLRFCVAGSEFVSGPRRLNELKRLSGARPYLTNRKSTGS